MFPPRASVKDARRHRAGRTFGHGGGRSRVANCIGFFQCSSKVAVPTSDASFDMNHRCLPWMRNMVPSANGERLVVMFKCGSPCFMAVIVSVIYLLGKADLAVFYRVFRNL